MRLLPCLLIFLAASGFAQDPVPPAKASKFRIGVNASFEQVSRRQGWHYAIEESAIESWNIQHIERAAGVTTSIRVGYAIGPKTDLELGLGYSYRQFAWDFNKFRSIRPPGPWITTSGERVLASRQLQYLEIPMRLSHMVGNGSLRWISSIGISTGISIFEPEAPPLNQPALFLWKPRKVNISPTISTGLAFFLNDRSDFRLEPTFIYGITPLTDISVQTFMWSAGLNFGYYRRF